jgi:flagellum-specific peptidoglycan hydrolase FlgJ
MSKGMGVSFEQFAETLIPGLGEEETTDETKKTDGVTTPVGGDDAGKATEVDTSSPETFVSSTLPTVTSIIEGSGIFPEVALAQAALESGWGKSVKGNNYYGIKGEGQTITTHEVVDGKRVKIEDEFREFEGFADSVTGYREFLTTNPRYEKALQADSPEAQAKALQEAGYATDPDYAEKLISIMKRIK